MKKAKQEPIASLCRFAFLGACLLAGCSSQSSSSDAHGGNVGSGGGSSASGGSANASGGGANTAGGALVNSGGASSNGGSPVTMGGSSNGGANSTSSGGASSGGSSNGAGGKSNSGNGGKSGGTGGKANNGGQTGQPVGGSAGSPADPCVKAGNCAPGQWVNVTPSSVSLTEGDCDNFGTKTVQVDRLHAQDVYTLFFCQGVWKSSDYGQTFTGPINKGMNGADFGDCAGGITLGPVDANTPPIIYASCIRGSGIGFWRSMNGGVDWTTFNVAPADPGASGQQFYPPVVDPYDSHHLLMVGHALNLLVESTDAGANWTLVKTDPGMKQPDGGTGGIDFIRTGDPATTRTTWLWLASQAGGAVGTWRTTNSGQSWTKVDNNEHVNGATQYYQPGTDGIIFMTGQFSKLGSGVLRSTDYGQHWTHFGVDAEETVVFGTSRFVYAMYGWGAGATDTVDPRLEMAAQPGTGTWSMPATPSAMKQGPAQAAVTNDGTNNIILAANYNAGLWRYVEPAQ